MPVAPILRPSVPPLMILVCVPMAAEAMARWFDDPAPNVRDPTPDAPISALLETLRPVPDPVNDAAPFAPSVVNSPVERVVAPMVVPSIEPPVKAILEPS